MKWVCKLRITLKTDHTRAYKLTGALFHHKQALKRRLWAHRWVKLEHFHACFISLLYRMLIRIMIVCDINMWIVLFLVQYTIQAGAWWVHTHRHVVIYSELQLTNLVSCLPRQHVCIILYTQVFLPPQLMKMPSGQRHGVAARRTGQKPLWPALWTTW